MKKISVLISVFLLFSNVLMAKTISGVVTSEGLPLPGVNVKIKGGNIGAITDFDGIYVIEANVGDVLEFLSLGFVTQKVTVGESNTIDVVLEESIETLDEVVVVGYGTQKKSEITGSISSRKSRRYKRKSRVNFSKALQGQISGFNVQASSVAPGTRINIQNQPENNNESYAHQKENNFKDPLQTPLSTFSIDVDAAAYSNMRRFIMNGDKPPKDAVRIEEMVNYFNYNYPQPKDEHPFSLNYEVASCPWNAKNKLVHVGLQGKTIDMADAPANNLVFLIDVSGSMGDYNKLPLLKKAFKLLVNQMRKKDRIAIVVYAGSSGVALPSTRGDKKEEILNALDNLQSGGSTAGGRGIKLAYKIAEKNFIAKGNNRIILATDGDFNVGQSSDQEMEKLITSKRDNGIRCENSN